MQIKPTVAPQSSVTAQAATPAPARAGLSAGNVSPEHQKIWSRVVQSGASQSSLLRTVLMNTMLVEYLHDGGNRRATLVCNERFASGALKHRDRIAELFQREVGAVVEVVFQDGSSSVVARPSASPAARAATGTTGDSAPGSSEHAGDPHEHVEAAKSPGDAPASAGHARAEPVQIGDHPLVKHAVEVFGAKIVDVQPRRA